MHYRPRTRFRVRVLVVWSPSEMRRGRGECRVKASPMARLQQETQAAVTTGSADQPAFPARWLTAYTWSPWRAGLSGHHVATTRVPRVALDTSIGVSGHHDF